MESLINLKQERIRKLEEYVNYLKVVEKDLEDMEKSFEKGDRLMKINIVYLLLNKLQKAINSWIIWFQEFDVQLLSTDDDLNKVFNFFFNFLKNLVQFDKEYTIKAIEKYKQLNIPEANKQLLILYARDIMKIPSSTHTQQHI